MIFLFNLFSNTDQMSSIFLPMSVLTKVQLLRSATRSTTDTQILRPTTIGLNEIMIICRISSRK